MNDEIDLPEPEHDHLLDHEFHDSESFAEADAQGILDEEEDENEVDDDVDYLNQLDQDD